MTESFKRHVSRHKPASPKKSRPKTKRNVKRSEICDAIFSGGDWHFTAGDIHARLGECGQKVSLATVYNTLHAFSQKGLIRRLPKVGQSIYFDTCTVEHAHIYDEERGELRDAPHWVNMEFLLAMPDVSDVVIYRPAGSAPLSEDDLRSGCCCG